MSVPAGKFSDWLDQMLVALNGAAPSDVPCGECTACCRSSQFVHIGPEETDAIANIPGPLLVPAPLLPSGHWLLGYDQDGCCPMLGPTGCTIYEHRPRACRTYDCRVFAAAGVLPPPDQPAVRERVERWRFAVDDDADRIRLVAVRAAAGFLAEHPEALPEGAPAPSSAQLAVLAVEVHDAFLGDGDEVEPTVSDVRVAVASRGASRRRPT